MPSFSPLRALLRQQAVTVGLIVSITGIYGLQIFLGDSFTHRFSAVPQEIVSAWGELRMGLLEKSPENDLFTLFSAALLHGDSGHLAGNMLFLWIFASIVSALLGFRWVLPTFAFTGICGNICHVALNKDSPIPCLGASGAVMGFEGLYLAMAVRWRLPDPHVWPIARPVSPAQLAMVGVLSLFLDFNAYLAGGLGVAYGAHLGGFVGGLFLGSFVISKPRIALGG